MKRARGEREGEDEKREPVDHHSTKCEVCAARETEKEREYQRMKKEGTKRSAQGRIPRDKVEIIRRWVR